MSNEEINIAIAHTSPKTLILPARDCADSLSASTMQDSTTATAPQKSTAVSTPEPICFLRYLEASANDSGTASPAQPPTPRTPRQ
jgi:hypothetical protein